MQKSSKYHNSFPEVDEFVKSHNNDLQNCTYGKFKKQYPKVKLSDAAFYARKRKALGLPSYSEAKKLKNSGSGSIATKTARRSEKLYKQFFTVPKNETTDEGLMLLSQFLDRMNHSNYNSHFEMVEIVPKTIDGNNEPVIEVREFK